MNLAILYTLVTVAFSAGGAYFLIQQSRKDVNGLGRKVGREINRAAARHQNITVALMMMATPEQRDKIADLLRESREEENR